MRYLIIFCFLISSASVYSQAEIQSELVKIIEKNDDYFKYANTNIASIKYTIHNKTTNKRRPLIRVVDFVSDTLVQVKLYSNNRLFSKEDCKLDPQKRVVFSDKLLYNGLMGWVRHLKRLSYTSNSQTIEELTTALEVKSKTIITYNTEKLPIDFKTYNSIGEIDKHLKISYNYDSCTYNCEIMNPNGIRIDTKIAYFIPDYILEHNAHGDVTKRYWPLAPKEKAAIHRLNYSYDSYGNWTYLKRELVTADQIKTISSINREITYF